MSGSMKLVGATVALPHSSTATGKADCRHGLRGSCHRNGANGICSNISLRGSFRTASALLGSKAQCFSGQLQNCDNSDVSSSFQLKEHRGLSGGGCCSQSDNHLRQKRDVRLICPAQSWSARGPTLLLSLHCQAWEALPMWKFPRVPLSGTRSLPVWPDRLNPCCCSLGKQIYRTRMEMPAQQGWRRDKHRMLGVPHVSSLDEEVSTEDKEIHAEDNKEIFTEDKPSRASLKGFPVFLWDSFQLDDLGMEIASIALPALFALAADPFASLVDTAFIGQLGAAQLGAVGISISVFNLMSKIFNVPLLNVTTSFVAEDDANPADKDGIKGGILGRTKSQKKKKSENPAVSASLALGCILGLCEAVALYVATEPVLSLMGLPMDSVMRPFAREYLSVRAMGAPAVVVSLATQGAFRGFGDTKSPLYAAIFGNVLNSIVCPLLIFGAGLGVGGAALATNISEYLMAGYLVYSLGSRCSLVPRSLSSLKFGRFLGAGSLLLGRSVALLTSMTIATSMAARLGTVSMATHQVCVQVWMAASLLADSLALAGQSILAGAFISRDKEVVRRVMHRVVLLGMGMGGLLSLMFVVGAEAIPRAFTQDPTVLGGIAVIIPFVASTQPINSLAFVFDGIHYGASDFKYAAYTTMAAVVPSIAIITFAPAKLGLSGVWMGLTLLMSLRMLSGFTRVATKSGPWQILDEKEDETEDKSCTKKQQDNSE